VRLYRAEFSHSLGQKPPPIFAAGAAGPPPIADAKASHGRVSTDPELPTFAEQGIEGIEAELWFALVAPAGTPREIIIATPPLETVLLLAAPPDDTISEPPLFHSCRAAHGTRRYPR
jgi:hypothetical protein